MSSFTRGERGRCTLSERGKWRRGWRGDEIGERGEESRKRRRQRKVRGMGRRRKR